MHASESTMFVLSGDPAEADALLSDLSALGYVVEYLPSITTVANVSRTVKASLRHRARSLRTQGGE